MLNNDVILIITEHSICDIKVAEFSKEIRMKSSKGVWLNMIIFEIEKEDEEYADRISRLADMSIVIDNPKSFSSELNTVIQIGVELAPYAISGVELIIIELIKKRKEFKMKYTDGDFGFDLEGEEEIVLKKAEELIDQHQEEKAKKMLNDALYGK